VRLRSRLAPLLVLIVPFLTAALSGCFSGGGGGGPGNVELTIDFNGESPQGGVGGSGVWTFTEVEIEEGETVFSLLLKASEMYNFTVKYHKERYGVFVEAIAGVEGGGSKWWVYYVNDVFGEVASDRKVVEDGDEILWIYSEGAI